MIKKTPLGIVLQKTIWKSCCRKHFRNHAKENMLNGILLNLFLGIVLQKHFGCPGKISVSGLEGGDKEGFRLTLFAQFILITMMKAMMMMVMKLNLISDGVGSRL